MHWRTKKFLVCVLSTIPTTVLAADRLLKWHSLVYQTGTLPQTAQELRKLYQLRQFCNQSNTIEKNLDLVIQKLRDRQAYWGDETIRSGSGTPNPKDVESQISSMMDRKNGQVQILSDRNSRYLEKIFDDVAKYGPQDPSAWSAVQAKHDELAQIVKSDDFQGCMVELDNLLPVPATKVGRQ